MAGTGHHRYRSDDLRLVQKNDCQKASGQHKLAEKVGDNDDLNRKDALDGDRSRVSMSIAGGEDGTAVGTDGGRKSDDTYEKTWLDGVKDHWDDDENDYDDDDEEENENKVYCRNKRTAGGCPNNKIKFENKMACR